ncbi:hypothetical protein ACFSSA_14305 [Luteolibacter algae]|uniref:Uncharacterized protein n=1 Tax=Luteolibacter algae TaxID=454151 RepID=A0ABW5DCU4_9BACT
MMKRRIAIRTLLTVALISNVPTQALADGSIKRSDVAFANQASPEVYRQYGATMVAWGFRLWELSGKEFYAEWKRGIDEAHGSGVRYQARVELDAGWRVMIDY